MEQFKSLEKLKNKQQQKEPVKVKNSIKTFVIKVMICGLIFISTMIIIKANPNLKATIYEHVYDDHFSFAKINDLYKKYFGDVLPFDNIVPNTELVFSESLKYSESNLYKDGVKLTVNKNYLVPVIESGIVVFIGEKENYNNTVIVQQINGIDVWYGNVNISDIKLYDYVEKGSMLGETNGEELYLVFQKEGKFLDYKEYIS